MKIEIDSKTDSPKELRAAAALCLMLAGDIAVPDVSESDAPQARTAATRSGIGTQTQNLPREMIMPPNPIPASIVDMATATGAELDAKYAPNVVPFPAAPPVPVNATAVVTPAGAADPMAAYATSAAPAAPPVPFPPVVLLSVPPVSVPTAPVAQQSIPASGAGGASSAASVEHDSAGLPWDARIHNKGRTKKKDGTWKLQKGLDPTFAQAIVQELIAKKAAAVVSAVPSSWSPPPPLPVGGGPLQPDAVNPRLAGTNALTDPIAEARAAFAGAPPAPQVPLPYAYDGIVKPQFNFGPMPVPPVPGSSGPAMVPPPPVAAPVPPASQPGTVGGGNTQVSAYKQLIDKLTAATQNKTLNPALVAPTVQRFGVPNMGMLSDPSYANLLPAINQEFDRLIAGGAPSGP